MIRRVFAVLWPVALLTSFVAVAPAAAAAPWHTQNLFFDAIYTHTWTAGPGVTHVGHREIATGVLRDADGRHVGTFSLTCTWTRIERGVAAETCAGTAYTADGRLDAAGPSQSNSSTETWGVTDGARRYRDASGTVNVRDLNDREALLSIGITTPDHVLLHAGKVTRPAANDAFIARANGLCQRAAAGLAALPPFPLASFDPLHPDPSALPTVAAFFTGAGDPRAILRALDSDLRALGRPAGDRGVWRAALGALDRELIVMDEQDRAALGANVSAFVQSVHHSAANFRRIAITTTVFGATRCLL
jgi:hypothetical protein